MKLCSSIVSLIILFSFDAVSNETVLVVTDSQSFINQVQNNKGDGTISSAYSLLFEDIGLPKQLTLMPLNRQTLALNQNKFAVCALYRGKSADRIDKYAFSSATHFLLNYNLYQQIELPPIPEDLLDETGSLVSLSEVAKHTPSATFLILPAYSYGNLLDKQISSLPIENQITWSGTVPHNTISKLFFRKRADYALMYPGEVNFYLQNNENTEFRQYSIKGTQAATFGYMMCNKHPDSYAYIETVNKSLKGLYPTHSFFTAHTGAYSVADHSIIAQVIERLNSRIIE